MKNIKVLFVCLVTIPVLFSACHSIPKHAKLIPANAVVVAGLNTEEIGKKIAWNAITGSKLFDEMKKKQPEKQDVFDPQKLGIELMSTIYVYVKPDKRFDNTGKVVALIPLEDADKWESFVASNFPMAKIVTNNDHKDVMLAEGMYAGWKKNLLIIMSTPSGGDALANGSRTPVPDNLLAAEMDNAFHTAPENAVTENEKFTALEKEEHDISLWINYDVLMDMYGKKGMTDMIGIPLSNAFWKDAALTAGIDFNKGKIKGDVKYYLSEEMKETGTAFGKENVDKDMVERLPDEQLNMLVAWHVTPKGVKSTLEKIGVLGFINLALMQQGFSADYILDAFTGDMVMSVNKFKMEKTNAGDTLQNTGSFAYNGDAQYVYVLKINKKENFDKLVSLAAKNRILVKTAPDTYKWLSDSSTTTLAIHMPYFLISNRDEMINNYISGKYKEGKLPEGVSGILDNPMGVYLNARAMLNALDKNAIPGTQDSITVHESRKLLQDMVFKGGAFANNAFTYSMEINFQNKEENSLLLLMDFASKISEGSQESLMVNK